MHPWHVAAAMMWNAGLVLAVSLPLAWVLRHWVQVWSFVEVERCRVWLEAEKLRRNVEQAKADAWADLHDRMKGITEKVEAIEKVDRAARTLDSMSKVGGRG